MAVVNLPSNLYYVYVLFRWDGTPFYIGKGKGYRWNWHLLPCNRERKTYKNNLINKTISIIGEVPRLKLRERLTELEAHATEIALIAAIGRHPNGPLVNQTEGGEGMSNPSPETREKLRIAGKRQSQAHLEKLIRFSRNPSAEVRARISEGIRGLKRSAETKRRMSEAQRKRPKEINVRIGQKQRGKIMSAASREKMRAAAMARPTEVRKAMSAVARAAVTPEGRKRGALGRRHSKNAIEAMRLANTGRKTSDEARAKQSAYAKRRSPQHRQRLAASLRRYFANKRTILAQLSLPGFEDLPPPDDKG